VIDVCAAVIKLLMQENNFVFHAIKQNAFKVIWHMSPPPKYVLPQMTEEDPKRKPVTWAFYCARSSWGCYAIEEDHFRTLKEAFTNSVRLVTGIVFFVIY
jgi:hypothetical protein